MHLIAVLEESVDDKVAHEELTPFVYFVLLIARFGDALVGEEGLVAGLIGFAGIIGWLGRIAGAGKKLKANDVVAFVGLLFFVIFLIVHRSIFLLGDNVEEVGNSGSGFDGDLASVLGLGPFLDFLSREE